MLPLGIDILRCLSDELTKISMDAGARATLAGKTGQGLSYFPGGELPSNSPTQTNFEPKIASLGDLPGYKETPSLNLNDESKEKARDIYIKARGPGISALKGAGGALLIGNLLTGGRLGRHTGAARFGLRSFGAAGAGIGLADYYSSGEHLEDAKKVETRVSGRRKATLPKVANFISSAFTPGRQLSEGLQTGSFKKMVHAGGRLRPPKVGQKFNFPGEPT